MSLIGSYHQSAILELVLLLTSLSVKSWIRQLWGKERKERGQKRDSMNRTVFLIQIHSGSKKCLDTSENAVRTSGWRFVFYLRKYKLACYQVGKYMLACTQESTRCPSRRTFPVFWSTENRLSLCNICAFGYFRKCKLVWASLLCVSVHSRSHHQRPSMHLKRAHVNWLGTYVCIQERHCKSVWIRLCMYICRYFRIWDLRIYSCT